MTKPMPFLLVEDDLDQAELVRRAFHSSDLTNELIHVSDGELALRYLRKEEPYEDAETPGLMLLDLNLPKVDGHEVLESVRSDPSLTQIPIVILSTSKSDDDLTRAYNSRVNSYVVKPFDFAKLRELVRDLGSYWAEWNEPPVDRTN